ncbi:MAG: TetR family transcriptional regulator [Proteobacteria bacterium]|nr:MAG: TetR family transcriptional regulator [Pseudomonadota bacterium]
MSLRDDKKLKLRAAISRLATELFIERGYEAVTTAEIARLAEVSVPTLFKYFPTKEALVFDEDLEREQFLVSTVQNRKVQQSILDSLFEAGLRELAEIKKHHARETRAFMKLIRDTPALNLYAQQMWLRHEVALAEMILVESTRKLDRTEARTIARFVLDSFHRAMEERDPEAALKKMFKLLKNGWDG